MKLQILKAVLQFHPDNYFIVFNFSGKYLIIWTCKGLLRLILIFNSFRCDNIVTDFITIVNIMIIVAYPMILIQYICIKPMSDSYIYMETADLFCKTMFCSVFITHYALLLKDIPVRQPFLVLPSLPSLKTCWQSARCAHTQETCLVSPSKAGSHWLWREERCQLGHRITLGRNREDPWCWSLWH